MHKAEGCRFSLDHGFAPRLNYTRVVFPDLSLSMKQFLAALMLCLAMTQAVYADDKPPLRVVYFDNYAPYS